MGKTCFGCAHFEVCFLRIAMWEGVLKAGQGMLSSFDGAPKVADKAMSLLGEHCSIYVNKP